LPVRISGTIARLGNAIRFRPLQAGLDFRIFVQAITGAAVAMAMAVDTGMGTVMGTRGLGATPHSVARRMFIQIAPHATSGCCPN
jgi:hypothetical protein